ncbi:hypothetical protein BKA70DRAFT_1427591 [Coprinopsis sp. MPI-PUGE-AT-0042]|nr:hypothetical protein BKA70DRAFT_1427591 [Coprinopsis sp. MPI-PUGE-AT-0042]
MRVFPTIPKIQASRPQWHKGCMWAGGGHGGGDEEDEEDTRRQRAHLNTPNSRLGLVTREGGDGFTERRAPSEVSDSILDVSDTPSFVLRKLVQQRGQRRISAQPISTSLNAHQPMWRQIREKRLLG